MMDLALPNDVLLLVGEKLERTTDRWNLALVSRHFHDLFLPLVYRHVSLRHGRDALSFLSAILSRPALARAVRELDLMTWHANGVLGPGPERREISNSALLNRWITSVSDSQAEGDGWIECLAQGSGDAWAALILPPLSRLRKLHLVYSTCSPHLDQIIQRMAGCKNPFTVHPPFEHLEEVSLHHREDFDLGNSADLPAEEALAPFKLLLPFFHLPSVRVITANSVVDTTANASELMISEKAAEGHRPRIGLSSITEIDLRASSGNHGMELLIASCAELKSFKYQHSDSHLLSQGYQPSVFYRSLSHSKDSLQTLWLDNYGSHHPFTATGLNQSHDEWFGSLVDFTALREVRVRLTNLLDIRYQHEPTTPLIECLPSSLETLYIEGCEEGYLAMLVSQLQTVIRNSRCHFPGLQRVDLEGAFQNVSLNDENQTVSPDSVLNATLRDKIFQAMEPLHIDCINAGIVLHLHDRTLPHL